MKNIVSPPRSVINTRVRVAAGWREVTIYQSEKKREKKEKIRKTLLSSYNLVFNCLPVCLANSINRAAYEYNYFSIFNGAVHHEIFAK